MFVVRKYILASSASEALKRERKHRPDEVFLDDDWKKEKGNKLESAIGFNSEPNYEE